MTICRFSPDAVRREYTPVDNYFIAEHLPHASGLQVQVYLYGLMQCRYPSMCDRPLHEALGVDCREGFENDSVSRVMQRGYKLKDRLLRPAKVMIHKA